MLILFWNIILIILWCQSVSWLVCCYRLGRARGPWQSAASAVSVEWLQAVGRGGLRGGARHPQAQEAAQTQVRGLPQQGPAEQPTSDQAILGVRGESPILPSPPHLPLLYPAVSFQNSSSTISCPREENWSSGLKAHPLTNSNTLLLLLQ